MVPSLQALLLQPRLRSIFFFLSFLCLTHEVSAQKHAWANFASGRNTISPAQAGAIDSKGNTYYAGTFQDSLFFNSQFIIKSSTSSLNFYLFRVDSAGNLDWAFTNSSAVNVSSMIINKQGRILLLGGYSNSVTLSSSVSLSASSASAIFLATFDTSGTLLSARNLLTFTFSSSNPGKIYQDPTSSDIYISGLCGNNPDVIDSAGNATTYTGTQYSFRDFYARYSANGNALRWIQWVPGSNHRITGLSHNGKNKIMLSMVGAPGFTFNSVSYPSSTFSKSFLGYISPSSGAFTQIKKWDQFVQPVSNNRDQDRVLAVEYLDTSDVIISGYLRDSVKIGNRKIYAPTYSGSAFNTVVYYYCARMHGLDSLVWIKINKYPIQLSFTPIQTDLIKVVKSSGQFYISALVLNDTVDIGGLAVSSGTGNNRGFVGKFDDRGNALWLRSLPSGATSLELDKQGDIYYAGKFQGPFVFDPFTVTPRYNQDFTRNIFIARTSDYQIIRGPVSKGPFCAGDSLIIPYSKVGEFAPNNEFIAELSDEEGNFQSIGRELGRKATPDADTIIGKLPLFNVASDSRYRIRIRSTNPPVQSFYRVDSLRLLIYSRDTANAGPDRTICFGDTTTLSNFGGTKWLWTPGKTVSDSTKRTVRAWPKTTTTYRLVIADSSGCGVIDTDYVTITVLPKLKATFNQSKADTILCDRDSVLLTITPSGGDAANYQVKWYEVTPQLKDSLIGTGPSIYGNIRGKYADRFRTTNVGRTYKGVLSDGCKYGFDTVRYTIKTTPSVPSAHISVSRGGAPISTVTNCPDKILTYYAVPAGGVSSKYAFKWVDQSTGTVLSTQDSISQLFPTTTAIWLVTTDNCASRVDTAVLPLFIFNPLSIAPVGMSTDTTLCLGASFKPNTKVTFGSNFYKVLWYWNNTKIDSGVSPTFVFNANLIGTTAGDTGTLSAVVVDLICQTLRDTLPFIVRIRPELNIRSSISDTTLCIGQSFSTELSASGGRSSTYQIALRHKGRVVATGASPNVVLTPSFLSQRGIPNGGTLDLYALLTDGCTTIPDSALIRLTVNPALNASISPGPTGPAASELFSCYLQPIELYAKAIGGRGSDYTYQWLDSSGTVRGTDSILAYTPTRTETISLIINDGCTVQSDSTVIRIKLDVPVQITANDLLGESTLCYGQNTNIQASGSFGSGTYNYIWRWNNTTLPFTSSTATFAMDSLITRAFDSTSGTLTVTISDAKCPTNRDSAAFLFKILAPLKLTISAPASPYCLGQPLAFAASGVGGKSADYQFTWRSRGQLLFTGASFQPRISASFRDNLELLSDGSRRIWVYLTDNCSSLIDSQELRFIVLPPIEAGISLSSSGITAISQRICKGDSIKLFGFASGGQSSSYQYRWFNQSGIPIGVDSLLTYSPPRTDSIYLVVTDGCTQFADTTRFTVILDDPLIVTPPANSSSLEFCVGQKPSIQVSTTGGSGQFRFDFSYLGNAFTSTDGNLTIDLDSNLLPRPYPSSFNLFVRVSDVECPAVRDSISISITLLAPLRASLALPADTFCYGATVPFEALLSGGRTSDIYAEWTVGTQSFGNNTSVSIVLDSNLLPALRTATAITAVPWRFQATDSCSQINPNFSGTFYVRAPLRVNILADSSCYTDSVTLRALVTGGDPGAYSYQWTIDGQASTNPTLTTSLIGSYQVQLTVSDGCSVGSPASATPISIHSRPRFTATWDTLFGCAPLTNIVTITNLDGQEYTYILSTPSGPQTLIEGPNVVQNIRSGSFPYRVVASNLQQSFCALSITLPALTILPKPIANFSLRLNEFRIRQPLTIFNTSRQSNNYLWDFGDGTTSTAFEPEHSYQDSGTYTIRLIAFNELGCTDTFTSIVKAVDSLHVFIPNAFSPGNDNLNEGFAPKGIAIRSFYLSVYDRWGQMVFIGEENQAWNGRRHGKATEPLMLENGYYYFLQVYDMLGYRYSYNGLVHLIRFKE